MDMRRARVVAAMAASAAMLVLASCSSGTTSSVRTTDLPPTTNRDAARAQAELEACQADTRTLLTAVAAWNSYSSKGDARYPTPWPKSDQDLVTGSLIARESSLHDVIGDGTNPPKIVKQGTNCANEDIRPLGG